MIEWLSGVDWAAFVLWAGALVLIAGGFIGTVVPALPGLPLIAAGGVLAGWAGGFERIGWKTIAVLVVLAVIGVAVDTLAQTAGAKRAGASRAGIVGSVIGTVAGIFMGLFGLLVMPFFGAVLGEFWARRSLLHAGRVGLATWIGMVVGTAVKVALAFTMTALIVLVAAAG